MRSIYLDYNTTTPLAPQAQEAMLPFLAEQFESPRGRDAGAAAARQAIDDATQRLAYTVGVAQEQRLLWTSGGWEAGQLAIESSVRAWRLAHPRAKCHLLLSAWDYEGVFATAESLVRDGLCELTVTPCDSRGVVTARAVEAHLRDNTAVVSMAHASATTGAVQPVAEIGSLCRRRGVPLFVDASRTLGKIAIDISKIKADWLAVSGHKCYAPEGVGALVYRKDLGDAELERVRRRTPSVAGIAAFGAIAEIAGRALEESQLREAKLRERLASQLRQGLGDELTIASGATGRLPTTLCVWFGATPAEQLLEQAPEVVAAIGCSTPLADSPHELTQAARFSLGWYTDEEEVDRAASLLVDAWERAQR